MIALTDAEWELLQYAASLDSHAIAPHDRSAVVVRALASHVERLEKRRFGGGSRTGRAAPRRDTAASTRDGTTPAARANGAAPACRHIPADIRRQVWMRDRGRCTFTSASGHRCDARERLEFDLVTPVARGGESVAANLRLRCRAHNRYAAEQAFGRGFMDGRIAAARERSERGSATGPARRASDAATGGRQAPTWREP